MDECREKDIEMMNGKGKHKGFGKGKNPPQQQMLYGKGKSGYGNCWTWDDPWTNSWKGKSEVHSVEEQYARQSGDGTLEVRTPTIEEAQNKGETLQSEHVQCVKVDRPTSDQKTWKCVKTTDYDAENRIKKLVTWNSDKDPRLLVRSNFLDGSSQGYVSKARSMKLQTSNRFEVLGADVNMDRSQHEVSLERNPAKNQEETETWCTKVTRKHSSRCKNTQLTQTMHLQFLEHGHGEEMVHGLDEGWMRVSSIMDSGAAGSVAPPTTCLHIPLAESLGSRAGQEYRTKVNVTYRLGQMKGAPLE